MSQYINKYRIFIFGFIAILIVGFILVWKYSFVSKNITIHSIGIDDAYVDNFSDDRILMGASHDVFIGKVIAQTSNEPENVMAQTQFSVQVISNIKGNLDGTVIVNQQGGYDKNGTFYYVEDGSPMLQVGETYLLVTRFSQAHKWYTLNSFPTASELISADNSLSGDRLRALSKNNIRVKQLEAAYPNEILLSADIKNNDTLNSYKSLHMGTSTPINR